MRIKIILILILTLCTLKLNNLSFNTPQCLAGDDSSSSDVKSTKIDIEYNKEDRDVGLKRLDIIDKALSPEIIERKTKLIRAIEQDYNTKIIELLQRVTTPISKNTVISHVNIDFFDPGFEKEVRVSQRVSVSIILDRTGFENWARGKESQENALNQLNKVIHNTFKIPNENISILVASD